MESYEPKKQYAMVEVFDSLQGEGNNTGIPMTFFRFAGCNIRCSYCDTPFEEKMVMLGEDLIATLEAKRPAWLVLTGGEPLLQVDEGLAEEMSRVMKQWNGQVAMESNGTMFSPTIQYIDYKVVSPKLPKLLSDEWYIYLKGCGRLQELRFLVDSEWFSPNFPPNFPYQQIDTISFSPMFSRSSESLVGTVDEDCLKRAITLVQACRASGWRVSVQVHKLLGVR